MHTTLSSPRTIGWLWLGTTVSTALGLTLLSGCSSNAGPSNPIIERPLPPAEPTTPATTSTDTSNPNPVPVTPVPPDNTEIIDVPTGENPACGILKCADLGWKCGSTTDECGEVVNCADEGLTCASGEVCVGGIDTPTECLAGGGGTCELCSFLPLCDEATPTRLSGRVITPGRSDGDTGNQVGVPNALVYILQKNVDSLPEIPVGIPSGGSSCDRCEDQQPQLGDVLFGAVTDATGAFTIEKYIPVGQEFTLVVKAGKFRRAVHVTVPETSACTDVALPVTLPDNPTRLPRDVNDGMFVHIPKIAISTGQIDAMECVFSKMGLTDGEFGDPGADGTAAAHVHLYRGGDEEAPAGASFSAQTPHSTVLFGTLDRMQQYDMVVADCEGPSADGNGPNSEAGQYGVNVREYVNRGGRMFASHLSFSWLAGNGDQPYSDATPTETGLSDAADWEQSPPNPTTGTGVVSIGSPNASPRIENFADWLVNEQVVTEPDLSFGIIEPRNQVTTLGEHSEEFIHCQVPDPGTPPEEEDGGAGPGPGPNPGGDVTCDRIQQFSFNTPYGAPEEASCGRVAYSGFHVAAIAGGDGMDGTFAEVVFPEHCGGALTDQEKVLLYMLFDLGACVGDPPPPPSCEPTTCEALQALCGPAPDGCGGVLDCGDCTRPPAR
jgi:hypothetical protein